MYSDSQLPTDTQRRALCELMHKAFLHIRVLGWDGNGQQAADLADAFHNLPVLMWHDRFSLRWFRDDFVAVYQRKYPSHTGDYLDRIDQIIAMRELEHTT